MLPSEVLIVVPVLDGISLVGTVHLQSQVGQPFGASGPMYLALAVSGIKASRHTTSARRFLMIKPSESFGDPDPRVALGER
jgi:hypothetical protein